ncbi:S-layer homology domain-containing protein [Paenibacillus sp. CAU 1782]
MVKRLNRLKSSIAFMTAVIMLIGLLPLSAAAAGSNGFSDARGHWAEESIVKVVDEGLFNGINENTFNPNGAMTRGMFVTVLNRLAEKLDGPEVSGASKAFSDVPSDAWYRSALDWAVKAKLTDGYGDGRFGPNDLLNREQITVLMIRFLTVYMGFDLAVSTEEVVFADDEVISSWAKKEVYQAQALGLIQGEKGNVFNPKGTAARAVVAVITERLLTQANDLANEQPTASATPGASPSASPTTTPAATAAPGGGGGVGGGGNGGSGTVTLTDVKINRGTTEMTGQKVYSGDLLSVSVAPSNATTTVRWLVDGVEKSTASTYTVQAFDVGAVITAQVTGTGSYSGTLASNATGKVLAKVDLSETNVNNTPVIIGSGSVFKDATGNEVTIPEGAALSFEVNLKQEAIPADEKTSVNEKIVDLFPGVDLEEVSINYLVLDANLQLEGPDASTTEIHPVGTTTLTLSKANLGFSANADISQHVFMVNHTNVEGISENVLGEVVSVENEQYVRFVLNGLSRVYIGNIPPLTISFDTQGGNEIAPVKVKLGEFTPPVAAPVKDGYLFIGWDVDLKLLPVHVDRTVVAVWLEGSYIPHYRLSVWGQNDYINYDRMVPGEIKLQLSETMQYEANLVYKLDIVPFTNSAKYVIGYSAEEVYQAKAYTEVSDSIETPIKVTDDDGKVVTGVYPTYIKWLNENDEILSIEAVKVFVETEKRSAYNEYTFNVDRGIGTFEAMLTGEDQEDYYAYLNGNLQGNALENNFNLSINASLSEYRETNSSTNPIRMDFENYTSLKLLFTPFAGETYQGITPSADAYYWGKNGQHFIPFNATVTEQGNIEVVIDDSYDLQQLITANNYTSIYVTVHAGEHSQTVYVNLDNYSDNSMEYEHVSAQTWSEVISALETYEKVYIQYSGEDVIVDSPVTIGEYQRLNLYAGLRIVDKGIVTVEGGQSGAYLYTGGSITIESGGMLTTNAQSENQSVYYHTSVHAEKGVNVASGGRIIVPSAGFLSVSTRDSAFIIGKEGSLDINGPLYVYGNMQVDGDVTLSGQDPYLHSYRNGGLNVQGNLIINNVVNAANKSVISVHGTTTIFEKGLLQLTDGLSELYGRFLNKGTIKINSGQLSLSNAGTVLTNEGEIELAPEALVSIRGSVLLNSGEISGSGRIQLEDTTDISSRYDNGIQYVVVEGEQTVSNYSRYKFTSDPKTSVKAIIYSSRISGEGTIAETIIIQEVLVQKPEDK